MRVSWKGVLFVAGFEGYVGHPYRDAVGVWTIGYGHTKDVGPHTKPISKLTALRLLRTELKSYLPPVADLHLPLRQNQIDALTSFVYNLGPGAISPSTGVGRALRQHHWREAADHMLEWDKAGGHVLPGLHRRRQAERHLFLK